MISMTALSQLAVLTNRKYLIDFKEAWESPFQDTFICSDKLNNLTANESVQEGSRRLNITLLRRRYNLVLVGHRWLKAIA